MPNERQLQHGQLQTLPKVDEILSRPTVSALLERAPRWAVVQAVRDEVARMRAAIEAGGAAEFAEEPLGERVATLVRPSLQQVLNATGVVLHTNLGRAPLAAAALQRVAEVAADYSNLEYQLDSGTRGSRHDHVGELLAQLTGGQSAVVVNNCAGAVLLALTALASGRGVVVSRGELVEIGGSFRVPDVMRASGARLVEVGTTNRTHIADYEQGMVDGGDIAALMKVHRSNFAQLGFVADVTVAELVKAGCAHGVPTLVDLGSGALVDVAPFVGVREPMVPEIVRAGADVVMFSGDKLLGGPQAGILVGSALAIAACRAHPLMRALRPDKLCLAALEATLELYRDGRALAEIPTFRMLSRGEDDLRRRAERLRVLVATAAPALKISVERVQSAVGGGSLPLAAPWSCALTLHVDDADLWTAQLRQLRAPLTSTGGPRGRRARCAGCAHARRRSRRRDATGGGRGSGHRRGHWATRRP